MIIEFLIIVKTSFKAAIKWCVKFTKLTEFLMPDLQRYQIQDGEEVYEIYIESKENLTISNPQTGFDDDADDPGGMGFDIAAISMEQTRNTIRGYTLCALSAFRNFAAAEIQEVNLKFGIKISAQGGVPFIAQGNAESNLEISVKCTFPKEQKK